MDLQKSCLPSIIWIGERVETKFSKNIYNGKQGKKWHLESADPAKAIVSWLWSNEQKREIND